MCAELLALAWALVGVTCALAFLVVCSTMAVTMITCPSGSLYSKLLTCREHGPWPVHCFANSGHHAKGSPGFPVEASCHLNCSGLVPAAGNGHVIISFTVKSVAGALLAFMSCVAHDCVYIFQSLE